MEGRIRHWNAEKFYGFIQTGAQSVFFHGKSVIGGADDIQEGMRAQFEVAETERGPAAVRVEILEAA
jgi:cold shock CspA family protein